MPFVTDWVEPEIIIDDPRKRITLYRAYDGQAFDDPLHFYFTVAAGENYTEIDAHLAIDSDWENNAEYYDVRSLPGYRARFLTTEPPVTDTDVRGFLWTLIESGHITAEWDK